MRLHPITKGIFLDKQHNPILYYLVVTIIAGIEGICFMPYIHRNICQWHERILLCTGDYLTQLLQLVDCQWCVIWCTVFACEGFTTTTRKGKDRGIIVLRCMRIVCCAAAIDYSHAAQSNTRTHRIVNTKICAFIYACRRCWEVSQMSRYISINHNHIRCGRRRVASHVCTILP